MSNSLLNRYTDEERYFAYENGAKKSKYTVQRWDKQSRVIIHNENNFGKKVTALGKNPQLEGKDESNIKTEVNNDDGTLLEPTRRNGIRLYHRYFKENHNTGYDYSKFNTYTQVDLYPKATHKASEIDDNDVKTDFDIIDQAFSESDYVLLAWGSGLKWENYTDEQINQFKSILVKNRKKLMWIGQNKDGSPVAVTSSINRQPLHVLEDNEFDSLLYKIKNN